MVVMDQLSAEFAKERTLLNEDVSSLIQEAIKPLQSAVDSLQSTMKSFQGRLTSVESVAGDKFKRLTLAESTIKTLQNHNQSLLDRIDDLENRSRRANLCIINIPEGSEDGKDPVKFMSGLLLQAMAPDFFLAAWTGESSPDPDLQNRSKIIPHAFLVCFSRFQQKEAALCLARNHELKYQGNPIRAYQDVSTALAKKRAALNKLCTRGTSDFTCYTRPGSGIAGVRG